MNELQFLKETIKNSGFFDEEFYLNLYADVKNSNIDPIEHYLILGWKEGRYPSLKFDTRSYLDAYPDVKESGMNALLHYILFGKKEGRNAFANNSKSNGVQDLKFIIYAPPFDENSGGNLVLHRLCDLLNKQGERSYIWLWGGQPQPHKSGICERFNTPFAKLSDLSDNTIVVYPEVVSGNPLMAKNVVRWLLYKPGFFTGEVNYGKDDFYFYTERVFVPNGFNVEEDNILAIRYLFNDIYKQTNFGKRNGSCYILRKGKGRKIIHDLKDSILIDELSHKEIADIFNKVEYCISYDLYTTYSQYAVMCGCKSIVVPENGISKEEWYNGEESRYGIAYGFNDLDYAEKTKDKLILYLKQQEKGSEDYVKKFIEKCKIFYNI
jgi:hypothetical protein